MDVSFCIVGSPHAPHKGTISPDRFTLTVWGVSVLGFQGATLEIQGQHELLRRRVVGTDGQSVLKLEQASQQGGWQ